MNELVKAKDRDWDEEAQRSMRKTSFPQGRQGICRVFVLLRFAQFPMRKIPRKLKIRAQISNLIANIPGQ
jgi:hypothetical protein